MMVDTAEQDSEFGSVPAEAVEWLASEGFLTPDDCSMNVACGRGGFARPMSRLVRILVCMDRNPVSLEETGRMCEGGCRTELFEQDWNSYVPSRGKYDSVLVSPSYLCYSGDALLRMEAVSKRSCIVAFPLVCDHRRLRKAILQSAGVDARLQEFSDPEPFSMWLQDTGRAFDVREFQCTVECPTDALVRSMVTTCRGRGVPEGTVETLASRFAESISKDGVARYRFASRVVAWNVDG